MRLNIRLVGVLFGNPDVGLIGARSWSTVVSEARQGRGAVLVAALAAMAIVHRPVLGDDQAGVSRSREVLADASRAVHPSDRGLAGALKRSAALAKARNSNAPRCRGSQPMLFGVASASAHVRDHPPRCSGSSAGPQLPQGPARKSATALVSQRPTAGEDARLSLNDRDASRCLAPMINSTAVRRW